MTTSTIDAHERQYSAARAATYAAMLAAARTTNAVPSTASADAAPGTVRRSYVTPAERRRRKIRTWRGVALVVIATVFETATKAVELSFTASRPAAVMIVTAVVAGSVVAIDQWVIPAVIRRRERNTVPPCRSFLTTVRST